MNQSEGTSFSRHDHIWKEDLVKERKLSLQQNVYKLEECLNQNDLSSKTGLENCVKTFVNELSFLMSDFHKLPSRRYINKSSRQIGKVESKQDRPWFTAECKRLYDIIAKR